MVCIPIYYMHLQQGHPSQQSSSVAVSAHNLPCPAQSLPTTCLSLPIAKTTLQSGVFSEWAACGLRVRHLLSTATIQIFCIRSKNTFDF
ncbi:hypothetical protein GDO86_015582 [Hymenochirus boettgeri]|uniref:Uncharacterized protein n=1 Tax=Hymenochirus boettgeri TaxID=247094 RepID=A0A8T2K1K3_9PIPI|nr:hypothetical protein GDO86_015582 [Hymenochirus boettgeri]